ncbi:MAG: DedA family protein [Eubacteriales bacterium]|nr:DedA family protein [Eubacteriales bacterium]
MELSAVLGLLSQYGVLILLVITCLEAMNCPGMPAGIVLPAVGIYAANGGMSIFLAIVLTIIGGMTGTVILYLIGRAGGYRLLNWLNRRSEKLRKANERCSEFLQKHSFQKIFVGRILPVVRTLLPLPAGAFRVDPVSFMTASALGIACYNIVFVGAGYFLGYLFV